MKELAVFEKETVKIKSAPIDPEAWLMTHHTHLSVVDSTPAWLEAGSDAIASNNGCVVSALSSSPDLQVEIVLAHLLDSEDVTDPVRERIFALAEAMERS